MLEVLIENDDPAQKIANQIVDCPALIFAGQGCQTKGMGRDLAETDKSAMDMWKQAETISGLPLREIYWEGDEEAMADTAALQPALTATHLNLWNAFSREKGIVPCATAGHSLGEYSALAAAGVISPEAALEITALRGKLMAEADPTHAGSMAAIVRLDTPQVMEIVEDVKNQTGEMLYAANFNMPQQTVISGTRNAVAQACEKAKSVKGRGVELKVNGAFHTPMMEEANRKLQPVLEKTRWTDPQFPVYSNVSALPAHTGEQAKKSILRQMISPVFWLNLIRNLYIAGIRWWIEISPRAVLGKMIGPSLAGIAGQCETLRVDLVSSLNSILHTVV